MGLVFFLVKMVEFHSFLPEERSKPRARSSNFCAYAFGSSTKRFADDKSPGIGPIVGLDNRILRKVPPPFMKSPSDGVQNGVKAAELALSRTYSDPKGTYGRQNSREKQEIAKAWLKFKEDIETAMQKKPNSGYYKNLADMMTTKMESLNTTTDQVGSLWLFLKILPRNCKDL